MIGSPKIIGSDFGIYQPVLMFNPAYMPCAVASVAILRWLRFAPRFAGFMVLVTIGNLPGQVDGPREAPFASLVWRIVAGACFRSCGSGGVAEDGDDRISFPVHALLKILAPMPAPSLVDVPAVEREDA